MSNLPEEKRKRRLTLLMKKVRESAQADRTRLIAWACLSWGCKKETIEEYLEILVYAGMIELEKGEVLWVGGE